jgi:hypothetical protein
MKEHETFVNIPAERKILPGYPPYELWYLVNDVDDTHLAVIRSDPKVKVVEYDEGIKWTNEL